MNYKELNKYQKDRMKQISTHSYTMEWENPEFMDYLLGGLPRIKRVKDDKNIEGEIAKLEKIISTYDSFLTNKDSFFYEIKNIIALIQEKNDSWYGLSIYELDRYLKIHSFCLISGEGGVGKSFFVKCFEEQLEQNNIEHLCLYGKFEKDTVRIDVEQIMRSSGKGFVFIFDAINEMTEAGQQSLLNILKKL